MNPPDYLKLLPCPHCGKVDTLDFDEQYERTDGVVLVSCAVVCNAETDGPGGFGASSGYAPSRELAAEKWNHRPTGRPEPREGGEPKILPCPFCGGRASVRGDWNMEALHCDSLGDCPGADVNLPCHTPQRRADSIRRWNTRGASN